MKGRSDEGSIRRGIVEHGNSRRPKCMVMLSLRDFLGRNLLSEWGLGVRGLTR